MEKKSPPHLYKRCLAFFCELQMFSPLFFFQRSLDSTYYPHMLTGSLTFLQKITASKKPLKKCAAKKRWSGKSRAKAMSWSTLWVLCHDCSFQSAGSPSRAAGVTSSQKLGMETTLNSPETSTTTLILTKTASTPCLESKTTSRNLWKFSMFIDA